MSYDSHKNFAFANVVTPPSSPTAGTSLSITSGYGTRFPTPPFNVTVWPVGVLPTLDNAEIIRVTGKTTDTLTIIRAQEGTTARAIQAGDQIANTISAKIITDLENAISSAGGGSGQSLATKVVATTISGFSADYYSTGITDELKIQDAVDATHLIGGNKVFVRSGLYIFYSTLYLYDDITLEGEGNGTIFKAVDGLVTTINMIQNIDSTNGNTNIKIKNIKVDGNYTTRTGTKTDITGHNIMLIRSSYCSISDVYSTSSFSTNFCLAVGAHHNIIDTCIGINSHWHNFLIVGQSIGGDVETYENVLDSCISISAGTGSNEGAGIEIAVNSLRNTITGCISRNSHEGGLHFFYRSNFNTVTGCSFYNNGGAGVFFVDESDNNTVTGNTIVNSTGPGISSTTAFLSRGGYYNTISDNEISGCGRNGIRGNHSGSRITNNTIDGCGFGDINTFKHGVYIAGSTDLHFSGNRVVNSADAGCYFSDMTTCQIINNNVSNNTGRGIFFDYSTIGLVDCIVNDNTTNNNVNTGISSLKGANGTSFSNNKTLNNGSHGLDIKGSIDCVVIANNASNNTGHGITLSPDSALNPCLNNHVSENHTIANGLNGINESGSGNINKYFNNTSRDNGGTDISILVKSALISFGTGISVTGGILQLSGSLVDTLAGAARGFYFSPHFTPPSNSASSFVGQEINTFWDPGTGITQVALTSFNTQNRIRGDGLISSLIGATTVAMVADSSSASQVQASTVFGFVGRFWGRPSGTSTATINVGVGFDTTNLASASGLTINSLIGFRVVNPSTSNSITNLIGFDIGSLTRGLLNIGLRIAAPVSSGGSTGSLGNAALQLSDTAGIVAGGILFGNIADTSNLYRSASNTLRTDGNVIIGGSLSMNSQLITNVLNPVSAQDAATKAYVDATSSGLDLKASVRVATTANITLSGTQTIDGISAIAGDRVLVKDQSTASENGIYVVASGAWSRATDADSSSEVTAGMFTFVSEGTVNGDNGFVLTTNDPITLASTSLVFTQFSGAGQITAGAGLTKTGNIIDAVGTANRILVNADSIDIGSDVATLSGVQIFTGSKAFDVVPAIKAGASTGEIAKAGGSIFDHFVDATVGGAETDIYTDTLPANILNTNGDKIIASYGGNFATLGTESVDLQVYFAGTSIWDSTGIAVTSGTTSWRIFVEIIRVSSSVVRYTVSLNTTGASGFVYTKSSELTGLTLSNTNILKITGTSSGIGSGSGDIVGKMGYVQWQSAA